MLFYMISHDLAENFQSLNDPYSPNISYFFSKLTYVNIHAAEVSANKDFIKLMDYQNLKVL